MTIENVFDVDTVKATLANVTRSYTGKISGSEPSVVCRVRYDKEPKIEDIRRDIKQFAGVLEYQDKKLSTINFLGIKVNVVDEKVQSYEYSYGINIKSYGHRRITKDELKSFDDI
jgi:hypothetical protein